MADDARPRLGRGLAALMGDLGDRREPARPPRRAPIEQLRANPRNPRKNFAEAELDDLTQSIRQKGVIQPILVRSVADDRFEIIAGERRWRAAQKAGQHDVPIVVIEANEQESLELAIIENIQRTDLNAVEEAAGYDQLVAQFGHSQSELAKALGKSRSHVANTLRLLKLPEDVREKVRDGRLSAGHARALLAVADPSGIAERIVAEGLTVRDVERLTQEPETARAPRPAKAAKDADTRALERDLGDILGLKVTIRHSGEAGDLTVRFSTFEQLDDIAARLRRAR